MKRNKQVWRISILIIVALLITELIFVHKDIYKYVVFPFLAVILFIFLHVLSNRMKENSKSFLLNLVFMLSIIGCIGLYVLFLITRCNTLAHFIVMTVNIISLLFTQCLLYRGCKKKWGNTYTSLLLLFNSIFMGIAYHHYLFDIRYISSFFPFIMFFYMEYFDYNTIYRKKNMLRLGILIFVSILSCIINPYLMLSCLFVLNNLIIKAKNKKILPVCFCYALLMLIVSGLCVCFGSVNFVNAYTLTFQNDGYYSIILCFLLILFYYYMLENVFQSRTNLYLNKSMYIICYALLSILLVTELVNYLNLIPLLLIYICGTMKENHVFVLDVIKYKKPKGNTIKKVSAVIPNYNYANYIEARIDSILQQNYPIYELIVLDDCSSDNSIEVIQKKLMAVKKKYPDLNVQFIPNEKNSGNVFKQWQKCFEVSTGDFLWICEADDLCSPYFLSAVMRGFQEDVIVSYSESLAIDENGYLFKHDLRDWVDILHCGRWNQNYIASGKDELVKVMCVNNTIANVSSVVFKKNNKIDYIKHLEKAQEFTLAGDWYFYSKVLLEGKIAYYAGSLNYHRMHSKSVTLTTDNFVQYKEILTIQNSIQSDISLPKKSILNIEKRRKYLRKQLGISDEELYYDSISLSKLIKDKKIKDEVLLSIIIPVYNMEQYLDKCLKSILKTLPEKTEVIIINDGSTDHSEDIIRKYAKQYNSIRYIHKKNGGLSSVKNRGLKEAKGRYIIYLDSDDYVASDMYSTMLKKAIDKDLELIYCDILMVFEDGLVEYCSMTNKTRKDPLLKILDVPLMPTSCNKMVKSELYNDLKFPEEFNNEDIAVTPVLLARAKKIDVLELPFYKYLQRTGSIQNSGFSEKKFMVFDAAEVAFAYLKDENKIVQEKIQAVIIVHQLLAILFYLIAKIEDQEERLNYIELFCKRYNVLEISDNNPYVVEFIEIHKVPKILHYIMNKDVQKIDKYIRLTFKA